VSECAGGKGFVGCFSLSLSSSRTRTRARARSLIHTYTQTWGLGNIAHVMGVPRVSPTPTNPPRRVYRAGRGGGGTVAGGGEGGNLMAPGVLETAVRSL
jgi:hypothetical protein